MDRTQLQALKEKYFEHVSYFIDNWMMRCSTIQCYREHLFKCEKEEGFDRKKFEERWANLEKTSEELFEMYGIKDGDSKEEMIKKDLEYLTISFKMDLFCNHFTGRSFEDHCRSEKEMFGSTWEDATISKEAKANRQLLKKDIFLVADHVLSQDKIEKFYEFLQFVISYKNRKYNDDILKNFDKDLNEFLQLDEEVKLGHEYYRNKEEGSLIWVHYTVISYDDFGKLFFEKLKATTC